MHEASIAAPLLKLVLEEAERNGREQGYDLRVTHVQVRAGLLLDLEAHTLGGIFSLMAEGTPAEEAELAVAKEPLRGDCRACGKSVSLSERDFRCPACDGTDVAWQGGNELYIASIRVQPVGSDIKD